ncbi:hypothetical protein KAI46_13985 [bacterium]|nr:hypothetical protein [bacterium]
MKKSIALITLALVFGLFCTALTWAGNGKGMGAGDGSMLGGELGETWLISGSVYDSGTAGTGLTLDEGNDVFTTVYGMGSTRFWDGQETAKPTVNEDVTIEVAEVTFSDGSTRLIAVSLLIDGTTVLLRTADGPVWRGTKGGGSGDGSSCRGNGSCDGSGVCPLTTE